MESNNDHIDLVKNELKKYNNTMDLTLGQTAGMSEKASKKFLLAYNKHKEKDQEYNSMIGAYYVNCNYFYYIEKINEEYILTRHIDRFERKTVLLKDESKHLEYDDFSHMMIIGVCYLVDFYKNRLGL
jgi:hypothetical protein